ncbi:MAG: hypothetical protein AAF573_00825 [Bacteroidota bacterium]
MNDKRPFFILGIAAVVLLLLFVFLGNGGSKYDWSENYEAESKEPYGSYVIHSMLNDYFPNNTLTNITESVDDELPLGKGEKSNYVFMGESMFLDSADVTTLLNFVNEGNNAFISSKTIPFDLMFELYYDECNLEPWDDYAGVTDTMVVFNFNHPQLKDDEGYSYKYFDANKVMEYQWHYIDSVYFCDEPYSMVQLGTLSGNRVNFAKKEYGSGAFYLHTTPINFTNFQLLDKVGLEYANKIFSHLDEGDIYWDEYSRQGEGFGRAYNRRAGGGGNRSIASEESLKYILAQPSLAWAWYLSVSLGLLYLFFRAKRKQRIIPVLEQNENTSFEFISTIGRLYFLQNDHKKLCIQKMKLFLSYIRDRYNLITTNTDDTFKKKLAAKSEVDPNTINKIFDYYKNVKSSSFVSEKTLIEFHERMDLFYKNCK